MQFNSPVEVNWNYMDTSLLQKFWAKHEENQVGMAPISDRILFFHRGITTVRHFLKQLLPSIETKNTGPYPPNPYVDLCDCILLNAGGQVRAQGVYINDKIDLLIQYLLVDPFQNLYSRIFKREVGSMPMLIAYQLMQIATASAADSPHEDMVTDIPTCYASQAKLHIALELGDSTGDKGFTLGQGPPATGEKPSHGLDRPSAASHKSASDVARVSSVQDDPLHHAAAQV